MNLKGKHFLKLLDLSSEEIQGLLDLAADLKAKKKAGIPHPLCEGKNIALIFEKTSTRTRCAFEVAGHDLGMGVTYLDPSGSQISKKESIADTARVLGRMFDGIEYRGFGQEIVEELADTLRSAFRIAASGRPGPVLVDIPKDVTSAVCEYVPKEKIEINETYNISEADLQSVADMIAAAERPMIYFGGGVESSDAGEDLLEMMRKADIPAAHTIMAIGCISDEEPLSLGLVGMHGTVSAAWAVERSDLLLCIGARFSDRVATNPRRFAPNAKIVHIDIDAAEINKNIGVAYSVVSDAKNFLKKVLPYIKEADHSAWRAQIAEWHEKLDYEPQDDDSVIHPHQLLRTVYEMAGEDVIVATDVGQHQLW